MKNKIALIAMVIVAIPLISGCARKCGDGICQKWESCPEDCKTDQKICPNKWCEEGENPDNCPEDCETQNDYWLPVDLPVVTNKEKDAFCKLTEKEKEQYYQEQIEKAQQISDELEDYIRAWYRGEKPAKIPTGLLPASMNNAKTHSWTLMKPEETDPNKQWYYIPAREEPSMSNFKQLYQQSYATHVTYLKLIILAPFDSQLIIEGDFPHARQMSFHIAGPFDPEYPVSHNGGVFEVPLVDVDIEADEGHVNPFLVGADRNADKRHYHVYFDLKEGNMGELNPDLFKDHYFKSSGNTRVGGPMSPTGPWGGHAIIPSVIWLRYYAPDFTSDGKMDPLGGVEIPRAYYKLKTGEEFWLQADMSLAIARQKTTHDGVKTKPMEPTVPLGATLGWLKVYGIMQVHAEVFGIFNSRPYGRYPEPLVKEDIRDDFACYFNQGPNQGVPGSIAHSATDQAYNNYLVRNLWLGKDKVYVLTGRLPTTPKTRNGEPIMEKAQARYWSICHTGNHETEKVNYNSLVYGCLMDDEITVDENNDYIIIYSLSEDKPENALPECGVTWQAFGPQSHQTFVLRWMDIYPDHYMEEYAPTDNNIPWETGAWSEEGYDKSLVGENKPGVMGPYHPVIHYLTKQEFERLGCPIDTERIPEWE